MRALSTSTPLGSPDTGLGLPFPCIASPSLGVHSENQLLDYEPNLNSPGTPVSDSILDKSTDDGGSERPGETNDDGAGEVYVDEGMVDTVISVPGEAAQQDQDDPDGTSQDRSEERGESSGKKNVGG